MAVVGEGVGVGVRVGVKDGIGVGVKVAVKEGVGVGVGAAAVDEGMGVAVGVGVNVAVSGGVLIGVAVAVAVGMLITVGFDSTVAVGKPGQVGSLLRNCAGMNSKISSSVRLRLAIRQAVSEDTALLILPSTSHKRIILSVLYLLPQAKVWLSRRKAN